MGAMSGAFKLTLPEVDRVLPLIRGKCQEVEDRNEAGRLGGIARENSHTGGTLDTLSSAKFGLNTAYN